MTPTATIRITAGLLVRGQVRREVRNAAEDAGLKCDVEQDGPDIRFHLSGDERKVFTRDDLADLIYHLEPTDSPLLEYLARAEADVRRITGILVTEKD